MELAQHHSLFGDWAAWLWNPGGRSPVVERETMPAAADLPAEISDAVLFARIAGGDEAAFAKFYDRHASLWFSIALRIVGDPVEAEDVLQEASVLIWARAPAYDPSLGKPATWAVTIVRNKAIDRFRSSKRKAEVVSALLEDSNPLPEPAGGSQERGFGQDDAVVVRRALARLAGDQRQAIELAFFGGLTQTEIAETLRQPLGTIKARIRRGMLHMRDALEGAL